MASRIDATARLTGTIITEEELLVEGVLEGSVRSTEKVSVARGGRIKGDVTGREVDVAGVIEGNVMASATFHLHPSGRIMGDVHAVHIQVEDGGVLSGKVITEGQGGFITREAK